MLIKSLTADNNVHVPIMASSIVSLFTNLKLQLRTRVLVRMHFWRSGFMVSHCLMRKNKLRLELLAEFFLVEI